MLICTMTINDIDQLVQENKKIEIGEGNQEPISKPVGEEIIYKKVAQVLGLENFSEMEKYKDEIKRIADYAKEQGTEDVMDFEWFVKQLEQKIGSPALGEKRIVNLSRYVYLLTEKSRVIEEINKMGGLNE